MLKPERETVLLEDFRRDPEAIRSTPSGRIEIFSDKIANWPHDCPGHPVWLEPYEWLGAPLPIPIRFT